MLWKGLHMSDRIVQAFDIRGKRGFASEAGELQSVQESLSTGEVGEAIEERQEAERDAYVSIFVQKLRHAGQA